MAGAKWGWNERGAEVRADGVGERIVGDGMEDEGRKGRWALWALVKTWLHHEMGPLKGSFSFLFPFF